MERVGSVSGRRSINRLAGIWMPTRRRSDEFELRENAVALLRAVLYTILVDYIQINKIF